MCHFWRGVYYVYMSWVLLTVRSLYYVKVKCCVGRVSICGVNVVNFCVSLVSCVEVAPNSPPGFLLCVIPNCFCACLVCIAQVHVADKIVCCRRIHSHRATNSPSSDICLLIRKYHGYCKIGRPPPCPTSCRLAKRNKRITYGHVE